MLLEHVGSVVIVNALKVDKKDPRIAILAFCSAAVYVALMNW
jgi:hypothetical protein